MKLKEVVLIGSGNVATHLAHGFLQCGMNITCVYSAHLDNAKKLAEKVSANAIDDLQAVPVNADLYLIAVSDDAIEKVANLLPSLQGIIANTSGSVSLTALQSRSEKTAVFYPLQSFSKGQPLELKGIPLCLESDDPLVLAQLKELAEDLTGNVQEVSSAERLKLHLAAVVVNNFTNHLLALSENYLEKENLSGRLLLPLIHETIRKASSAPAKDGQTGPAKRNDQGTIGKHLELLEKHPELKSLYQQLSESIYHFHSKN